MLDLAAALKDFATFHRSPANRAWHVFGILGSTIAVLGGLALVPVWGPVDLALLFLAGTLVLDLLVDWRIALGVAVAGLACWALGRLLDPLALGALLVAALSAQFVGHRVFEGNAPAFTVNLIHLYVGPRWIVNRVLRIHPER